MPNPLFESEAHLNLPSVPRMKSTARIVRGSRWSRHADEFSRYGRVAPNEIRIANSSCRMQLAETDMEQQNPRISPSIHGRKGAKNRPGGAVREL